ncbi:MAG: heavy-metal-associated domain-containing protein [Acidimicrobiales bacterium]|nr:cation transporter [Acidimicrobiia bacterium]NNF53031.1 heavy-metal-associated domain-containing protein [Acidimicrobiales bacterium]
MTTTRIYSVPEISCDHCKNAIESEVNRLDTVEAAVVDIETKTVLVSGDADEQLVRAAIDEAGYDVASVTAT